ARLREHRLEAVPRDVVQLSLCAPDLEVDPCALVVHLIGHVADEQHDGDKCEHDDERQHRDQEPGHRRHRTFRIVSETTSAIASAVMSPIPWRRGVAEGTIAPSWISSWL